MFALYVQAVPWSAPPDRGVLYLTIHRVVRHNSENSRYGVVGKGKANTLGLKLATGRLDKRFTKDRGRNKPSRAISGYD